VKALQGKRIVITRPRSQMDVLVERLQALGAEPIAFPTIAIVPQTDNEALSNAIKQLQDFDWLIFTSRNGVEVFWDHFTRVGANLQQLNGLKIAAIGPATAAALAERSAPVHLIPPEYVAEAILDAIGEVRGLRILLPRAEIARPVLADELVRRGAEVNEIAVYQTMPGVPDDSAWQALREGVDVVTFTSSSTVRNFFQLVGDEAQTVLAEALIACIGPITAGTVEQQGYNAHIVAAEYTTEGLVQALVAYYEKIHREG
jgi:uroporphyrinogen-III synthase